jgi:outer membrane receptor protein involved in Fe transport
VNFIMRRINGVEVSAGISAYQHDNGNKYMQDLQDKKGYPYPKGGSGFDGSSYNIEIAMGSDFADGKGNATAYITWRQNAALLQDARDYSSCALGGSGLSCSGSATAPVPNFYIYGVDANGDYIGDGELYTLQPDSSLGFFDGSNTFNFNPTNFYMRPQTSWTAGAFIDYEINERAVVYTEMMLANNDTRGQIAYSGTFFNPLSYSANNTLFPPNFKASLDELFPGAESFAMYPAKRNVEGGPRTDALSYSSFRVVAGMKGMINENWDYDVSFLHSQSNSSSNYLNDLYGPYVQTATEGEVCAATPGCIPYQLFTYNGVTPEQAAGLSATAGAVNRSTLDIVEAFVTGDTGWGLPAGNIMMAGGYQWIQTKYDSIYDDIYAKGLLYGQGGPRQDVSGTVRANQLFVEGNIPLLADEAFAQNLSLDLAYRWSDYNTTGANSTYRAGLDWQINDMFRVRTGYNRAVRAPSVAELFSPQTLGLWSGVDPCAGSTPVYSQSQCANTGVSAEDYGSVGASPAGQYNGLGGGNTELMVETADTFTFGFVVNPLDTMQFSVDYWDIKIDDTITNIFPETTLNNCAETGGALCDNINRGFGGNLWIGQTSWVVRTQQNIGSQHWRGIDVAWAYSLGTNWQFDLIGTYTLEKETVPLPDDPTATYDCAGVVSPVCYPNPDWRHTATATYDSNSWWALTARWRFMSSVDYQGTTDKIAKDNLGKTTNYLDLNAVVRFMDTNDVTFGVNNVLDKDPPMMGNTLSSNGNTFVGFYDTLGRYFYADVTFRW